MSKYEREKDKFQGKVAKPRGGRGNRDLKKVDSEYKQFVKEAEATDMLLQEEVGFLEADGPMEKTYKFRQEDIVEAVDQATSNKKIDLKLTELGPYSLDFTRNGRKMLIAGRKGHVASMDWRLGKLDCELFLNETVHAVKYFHSDQYFAAAQKKYVFVYDKTGLELHRLDQHPDVTKLDFLPYHFLLVTAGNTSMVKFHDVSTGFMVSEHKTKLGPTQAMKQNPWNAVINLGHTNGTVTMWSPSMGKPLAKMQLNRGPVRDIAVDREGKYMAVSGSDKTLRLWDLRMLKELDVYHTQTPAMSLDVSDTGLLAAGWGPNITIWKDAFKTHQREPYMKHLLPSSKVERARFVPLEDVLGVGHAKGVSTVIVPGAGEANYDALEVNPYESGKQRQEGEVRALLNKLAPDTIAMDPTFIGTVDKQARNIRLTREELEQAKVQEEKEREAQLEARPDLPEKHSKLKRYLAKSKSNVMDARKMRAQRNLELEKERRERMRLKEMGVPDEKDKLGPALGRFV